MTSKIIFNIGIAVLLSVVASGSIAEEKVEKKNLPVHLVQQQVKIDKIKATKEGQEIFKLVDKASEKHGVDKKLVHAVILAESGYNVSARSKSNCVGLMQLGTVHANKCNRYDKASNIDYGTKHLAGLLAKYNGNERLAISAYNAGGGAVDRSLRRTGRVPNYTKPYINKVIEYKVLYSEI